MSQRALLFQQKRNENATRSESLIQVQCYRNIKDLQCHENCDEICDLLTLLRLGFFYPLSRAEAITMISCMFYIYVLYFAKYLAILF